MSLMERRAGLMGRKKDGNIWLFKEGIIFPAFGGLEAQGPNEGKLVTVSIANTIRFTFSYSAGATIKTLVSANTIRAKGKTLHIIIRTLCTDGRARNCWFFAFASKTVTETQEIPENGNGISQYFPEGDGSVFYIPLNDRKVLTSELTIPITQDNAYVSIGVLKQYIFVNYAEVVEMWIE